MKPLLFAAGALLAASTLFAQAPPPPPGGHHGPAQSPAAQAEAKLDQATLTIDYSSPRVRGREGKIFTKDGLISHDPTYPVWRAGANAATLLTVDNDVKIGDLLVPKGSYTLWIDISDPAAWVLIVNKQTGQWGVKYDKALDLGRVPMQTVTTATSAEELKYTVTAEGRKGTLTLSWEKVSASVEVLAPRKQ